MTFRFLVDTYDTERLKVLTVWSMFRDEDLPVRPRAGDRRGRSVQEQMIHQCVSEDLWFRTILGIDVGAPPLPDQEIRIEFMRRYALDSERRLEALGRQEPAWWESTSSFFGTPRTRAWVVTRRIAHTAHHRGQQVAMLRMLGRFVYSTYGPTADTGGLPQDEAPTIYPYANVAELLGGEEQGGRKVALPKAVERVVTERGEKG